MRKILIIEDNDALVEEYLRMLRHELHSDCAYTCAPTLAFALPLLAEEDWDDILVDSDLGPSATHPPGTAGIRVSNGAEAIAFRRGCEAELPAMRRSHIVAIASNRAALRNVIGADRPALKTEIPDVAKEIATMSQGEA